MDPPGDQGPPLGADERETAEKADFPRSVPPSATMDLRRVVHASEQGRLGVGGPGRGQRKKEHRGQGAQQSTGCRHAGIGRTIRR